MTSLPESRFQVSESKSISRAVVLQRLSRLVASRSILLDPAALAAERFEPPPGVRALVAEEPARLYMLGRDYLQRLAGLPEEVCAADVAERLERPGREVLEPRFLPLDHPEGIINRFNHWFYMGKGERAFTEGQVPTGLARDPHMARGEAALISRLARSCGCQEPRVLKLGAGCDVEPIRLLFEELERLAAGLAGRCRVMVTDLSPLLVEEARRRANLDPKLRELTHGGQVSFEVLDARQPGALGEQKFLLIQSSYLYDSLPQRELAWVGGRWYEIKARPLLVACSQREQFRKALAADDLAGLREIPTHHFGYLDWEVALDPLAPQEVPYGEELEDICRGAGEVAVPLGDALIAGFEGLLPHLVPGGVLQTFDLGIADIEGASNPHLKPVFKGPHRICAALFLGQNFALAARVFSRRGLKVSLLPPDRYLDEMLGEEVICLDRIWEEHHKGTEALERLLGADFLARFRGCFEGEGGSIFRAVAQGHFLTRPEGEEMVSRLSAAGLDGRAFVDTLFAAKGVLGEVEANSYLQFRIES
jgi:hypothetical protein